MNAKDKLEAMKQGKAVITNDDEMDEMLRLGDDAAYAVRSLPNPKCCGLRDQYVAWIGEYRETAPDVVQ